MESRVRLNFSQDAKGLAKMDITSEHETPEMAGQKMDEAIDIFREVLKKKGLKIVGETTID